jgi:D-lactate dehydrogenase (cytochrome)
MNDALPIADSRLAPGLLATLRELLGPRLSTSAADRAHHGRDEGYHPVRPPDAVVRPLNTAEVQAIVGACAAHRTPIIPFGAGTSLEGHVGAVAGGVCIDMAGMNAILEVRPDDSDATVQAGVTRKQLNAHLRDTGLFFAVDPGADATLGGMASTRASGTMALRYGTMRETVLNLSVVLSDGSVIRTGTRARKSSAGYDLTRLFVGSEGTLGVVTEVTVRLFGQPEATLVAVCPFATVDGAVRTVIEATQLGLGLARMELMNVNALRAVNAHAKLTLAEVPTLFLEFHGTPAGVAEQAETFAALAEANGGAGMQWANDPTERSKLWQARHDMHYAVLAQRPGAKGWATDVCVPISRLAECIGETQAELDRASFFTALLGHVGDGNFHCGFLIDPDDPAERAEAEALNERLMLRAIGMGGTCTGEHGIGVGKRKFLRAEHGDAVDAMRRVKLAFDPLGIMNPGKVLPED